MKSEDKLLQKEKTIIGISTRTRPETAGQDIAALWGRFVQGAVSMHIRALDSVIYSVYCEYETDSQGAYTTVLGCEVPPDAPLPPGMKRVVLPAGPYTCFAVQGDPRRAVWDAWTHINSVWSKTRTRRYETDFECYTGVSPTQVEAEIYVQLQK